MKIEIAKDLITFYANLTKNHFLLKAIEEIDAGTEKYLREIFDSTIEYDEKEKNIYRAMVSLYKMRRENKYTVNNDYGFVFNVSYAIQDIIMEQQYNWSKEHDYIVAVFFPDNIKKIQKIIKNLLESN